MRGRSEHFPGLTLVMGGPEDFRASVAFGLASESGACVIDVDEDGQCPRDHRFSPDALVMGNRALSKAMLRRAVADHGEVIIKAKTIKPLNGAKISAGRIIQISIIP